MPLRPLAGLRGKTFRAHMCLLAPGDRTLPNAVRTLTTSATPAAKGAAVVTLSAAPAALTGIKMVSGQPLLFEAPNGILYYAETSAAFTADGTDTTIDVKPLDVAIPAASVLKWPIECQTRATFDRSSTAQTVQLTSYQHNFQETAVSSRSGSLTADGYYSSLDPFSQMVLKAAAANQELAVLEQYPIPAAGYLTGEIQYYAVIPTGDTQAKPEGGFLQYNATLALQTEVFTVAPTS